jgi:hypothetical protein
VKNQHFGENRDLLKFDLVDQILKSGLVGQFVYVPMLTVDEPGKEAENICRHESTGGAGNVALMNFLDFCVVNDRRQVKQLETYFKEAGFQASVYAPEKVLTTENRKAYFEGIAPVYLENSLILIDPDMGLEDDDNNPANLMYSEIRDMYNLMEDDSILMFTQRFPYDMYEEYLGMRTSEIKSQIPLSQPVSIDDLDSIIFFLARNQSTLSRLIQVLTDYTKKYAQKAE